MKKLSFILLRFFIFIVVLIIGLILIWDQIAYDFGNSLGISGTGFLKAVGLVSVIEGFTTNNEFLGYSLIVDGSAGLFIFLAIALVRQLIPILGKVIIFMLGIVPIIAAILIIVGSLIWVDIIPLPVDLRIPGFNPLIAQLLPVVFPILSF